MHVSIIASNMDNKIHRVYQTVSQGFDISNEKKILKERGQRIQGKKDCKGGKCSCA